MAEYMLTVIGAEAWDVLVIGVADIRAAIALAEKATGCGVSHGRTYHASNRFDPATIVHADGTVERRHNRPAVESLIRHRPNGGPRLEPAP